MPASLIRVLVVDDDAAFAETLAELLETDARIRVVGFARNGEEALALARSLRPDVVTMDIDMPILNGIEAIRRIVASLANVRVLVVSGSEHTALAEQARVAGAAGYIAKSRIAGELLPAVAAIAPPESDGG